MVLTASVALGAENETLRFERVDLLSGRSLRAVTIRTYHAPSERVLLVANGTAMTVPIAEFPAELAAQLKAAAPESGASTTEVPGPAAPPAGVAAPPTAEADRPSYVPAGPDEAELRAMTVEKIHRAEAAKRAQRYFAYEHTAGSSSISVYDLAIDTDPPLPVQGWEGRYRTRGTAYGQYFDSRGRSFQRFSHSFEVTTEQRAGAAMRMVEFIRLD